MTRRFLLLFLLLSGLAFAQSRVYELRTYTSYDGKLEAVKARFRDHTISDSVSASDAAAAGAALFGGGQR